VPHPLPRRLISINTFIVPCKSWVQYLYRETLDGLRRVGFRLNRGHKDAGVFLSAYTAGGGYYLGKPDDLTILHYSIIEDVGGSQYVIDGKIKLKNDTALEGFTETGLKFSDGSELPADVVIFCTG